MERSPERSLNSRPDKYGRTTEAVLNLLPITQSNQRLPETLRYHFVFRYSFFMKLLTEIFFGLFLHTQLEA